MAYLCPKCQSATKVLDVRGKGYHGNKFLRRRRQCLSDTCKHRLSTLELSVVEYNCLLTDINNGKKLLKIARGLPARKD